MSLVAKAARSWQSRGGMLVATGAATAAAMMLDRSKPGNSKGRFVRSESAPKPTLANTASRIALDINGALDRVSGSSEEEGKRVTFLAPLIEARRAALDAGGFENSKALDSALLTASKEGADDVTAAASELADAEARWKRVLDGLEAAANKHLNPPLRIGDQGPEFRLSSASGDAIALSDLLKEGPSSILLIWLRHFG